MLITTKYRDRLLETDYFYMNTHWPTFQKLLPPYIAHQAFHRFSAQCPRCVYAEVPQDPTQYPCSVIFPLTWPMNLTETVAIPTVLLRVAINSKWGSSLHFLIVMLLSKLVIRLELLKWFQVSHTLEISCLRVLCLPNHCFTERTGILSYSNSRQTHCMPKITEINKQVFTWSKISTPSLTCKIGSSHQGSDNAIWCYLCWSHRRAY